VTSAGARQDRPTGLRRLLPHAPVLDDEGKGREARLAYLTAWILFVIPLSLGLLRLFIPADPGELTTDSLVFAASVILPLAMAGISLFCMAILHRGSVRAASAILVGATWLALVLLSATFGGVRDVSYAGLLVVVVLAGLLLGGPASAIVVGLSLVAGWALADAESSGLLVVEQKAPLNILIGYAALFSMAAYLVAAANTGFRRLLGRVYQNERDMRAQNWELRQMRDSLERRVAERTEDLNRRSGYLEAAARVAYAAAEILDVEDLLRGSVDLIREAFGLYYVGLFLVAPGTEDVDKEIGATVDPQDGSPDAVGRPWAVLRAGSGEAGRKMLARGHRIRVGEGMVGWSIEHEQSRFAQHAVEDRVRLVAPELPETRAEAALPLRSRGRVVGALTVQSVQANFFDEDTVTVLQTMADLIAVALSNAELFEESEMAMQALRRAYGEISVTAWEELLRRHRDWGYRYAEGVVEPIPGAWIAPFAEAASAPGAIIGREGTEVVIPMRVGDAVIGAIRYQRQAGERAWEEDDVMLLNALTEQLVQALDSARLLQETQRQAAREQQVSEIAALLANTVDVDTMLRTAVQELGRLPGVVEASVHLGPVKASTAPADDGGAGGNGDHG
jgi:GAF domain-containing protein